MSAGSNCAARQTDQTSGGSSLSTPPCTTHSTSVATSTRQVGTSPLLPCRTTIALAMPRAKYCALFGRKARLNCHASGATACQTIGSHRDRQEQPGERAQPQALHRSAVPAGRTATRSTGSTPRRGSRPRRPAARHRGTARASSSGGGDERPQSFGQPPDQMKRPGCPVRSTPSARTRSPAAAPPRRRRTPPGTPDRCAPPGRSGTAAAGSRSWPATARSPARSG